MLIFVSPTRTAVFLANRDPALALEVARVHHAILQKLMLFEGARLPEQKVQKRGFSVVNVRDDANIS